MLAQYRKAQRLIPVLFIAYTILAVGGGLTARKGEIFPFFNWSLFTHVSDHRTLVEIEVVAINGAQLDAPTRIHDLSEHFAAARSRSINVVKLARRMAAAHSAGDRERFEGLRKLLEASYLSEAKQITYRLVVYRYNPIERWRDGSIRSVEVIGAYSVDRSS